MAGKKNPNLGDKLRQEREGAENTLRDSRSKLKVVVVCLPVSIRTTVMLWDTTQVF